MKRKIVLKCSLLIMMYFLSITLGSNMNRVCAQVTYSENSDLITLESAAVGDDPENYLDIEISNINKNDVITVESDNSEVVGFTYLQKQVDVDKLEFGMGDSEIKDGKWMDDFSVIARHAGNCNVTVSVNGITDKIFKVIVNPTKPTVSVESLYSKSIWNVDTTVGLRFSGISKYSEITISSNKKLSCSYGTEKPKTFNIQKKAKTINLEKLMDDGFYINPKMKKINAGTYKIMVTIKQDGNTYNIVKKLNVKKYVSPFSSFKIGSVDLTNKFKNHRTVSEEGRGKVSIKTAKKTLGKPLSIKVKKGYTVYKITYKRKDEWTVKPHKLKFTTSKNGTVISTKPLANDFWELYIYYKKGNKKMGYTCVWWSYGVFN